jgi:hypothetical protein
VFKASLGCTSSSKQPGPHNKILSQNHNNKNLLHCMCKLKYNLTIKIYFRAGGVAQAVRTPAQQV